MSLELHDWEIQKIGQVWYQLMEKYRFRRNTVDEILNLNQEATQKFYDAGFEVELDFTPMFMDPPESPIVEIIGRTGGRTFDYELAGWEVKKAKEEGKE